MFPGQLVLFIFKPFLNNLKPDFSSALGEQLDELLLLGVGLGLGSGLVALVVLRQLSQRGVQGFLLFRLVLRLSVRDCLRLGFLRLHILVECLFENAVGAVEVGLIGGAKAEQRVG